MAGWNLEPGYSDLAADFGSLEAVFALEGERLTRDPLSEVIRVQRNGVNYYVKRYSGAGKAALGRGVNGWRFWRLPDGRLLRELTRQEGSGDGDGRARNT